MIVPDLIYDVGMHVGNDAASYMAQGYRVIGIEANPVLVEHCRKRFERELSAGVLKILPVGVSDVNGVMPFYVNTGNNEWSSFDKEIGWRDAEGTVIEVPTMRFEEILEQFKTPFYLKVDIEGLEGHALNALKSLKPEDLPQYVSTEANSFDYLMILRSLGYEKYKLVDMRAHGILAFSGPFGENTPGEWLTLEQVAYEWLHQKMKHIERMEHVRPDPLTWYDWHAKRTW